MFSLNEGLLAYIAPDGIKPIALFGSLLLVLIAAYLLGSVSSAAVVSKIVYKDSIDLSNTEIEGATQMLRKHGIKAGIITAAADVLKIAAAVFIAGLIFGFGYVRGISVQSHCYLTGLFAVVGHVFPIYNGFKGGLGALPAMAMMLILSPVPTAILLLLFAAILLMSRYVALASVTAIALYPVIMHGAFSFMFNMPMDGMISLSAIIIACLMVWTHRKSLERIGNKTERKISFRRKDD